MDKKTLVEEIIQLKKQHNAILLAHNYQLPEVQDIADHLGDSLELAKIASKTTADVIVFCGVKFMAESAKILNPQKTVLLPDIDSNCPLADTATPQKVQKLKAQHPNAQVVAYINTTAAVKAEADICCTSANGVSVVKSIKEQDIIFLPDKNLGHYISKQLPEKNLIIWPGYCYVHHEMDKDHIKTLKEKHPQAELLVHPECQPDIVELADHVYSTNGMVHHAKTSDATEFIIGTEKEMCYRLRKENPNKTFYEVNQSTCLDMKKITLEKIYHSLKTLTPEITLPEETFNKAKKPLEAMMNIKRGD